MESECSARVLALLGILTNAFSVVGYVAGVSLLYYSMMFGYPWYYVWNWPYFVAQLVMLLLGLIFGIVLPIVAYPRVQFKTKNTAAVLLVVGGTISLFSLGGLFTGVGGLFLIVAGAMTSFLQPPRLVTVKPLPWETTTEPALPASDVTAPGALVTPSGARYCVACGAQLEGNERRCPACATPID